jgi:membrane protein involved in colicin uptake
MTYEEMQTTMAFIVEQQAQITRQQQEFTRQLAEQARQAAKDRAESDALAAKNRAESDALAAKNKAESDARMKHLEATLTTVVETVQILVALAQTHEERMDSFVKTIERYVQARGNNGSGT